MPSLRPSLFQKATLIASLSLASAVSAATSINYGDFIGDTVAYENVTESSFTDALPMYGPPTITGNLLDFDPVSFGAASSNGASDQTDGQLNFSIDADPGVGITTFTIFEGGDLKFTGLTPDAGTFVSASVSANISILEIDGVTLGTPIDLFLSNSFFTNYLTVGNPPVSGLVQWSLLTNVDLTSVLPNGYVLGATLIEVAIDNFLTSTTTTGNTASIAKKEFRVDIAPVPEPTSLALMGIGGLLLARRRR